MSTRISADGTNDVALIRLSKLPIARGQMPRGEMNQTERRYAEHLDRLRLAGEILWYRFEPFSLRIAGNTFYRPDFMVMAASMEIEIHEVKGFWREDARAKTKVAAGLFPIFRFLAVKYIRGQGWEREDF